MRLKDVINEPEFSKLCNMLNVAIRVKKEGYRYCPECELKDKCEYYYYYNRMLNGGN